MVLLCWDSITTGKTFSPGQPAESRRTAWSARRFTFSPPIRRRRCSGKWKRRGVCCTAIGLCMTRHTRCSAPNTCHPRNWNKVIPGCINASSHTPRSGDAGPRTGAPLRRTWRCRTCTSAPTGSGECSSNTTWFMPRGDRWWRGHDSGTYTSARNWPPAKRRAGTLPAWCRPVSSGATGNPSLTFGALSGAARLDEPLAGLHTPLDTYNIGGFRGFLQIPFERIERRGIAALLIQHLAQQPAQARIRAPRVGTDAFPGGLLSIVITIQIAVRAALDLVHARIGARGQPVHHRGPARGFRRILVFGSHVRQLYERFGIGRVHRNGLL